jgi:hypothetical protein
MTNTELYFSADYRTAQSRFRAILAEHGGRLDSLVLAAKGPRGEDLAIDIGWFGASNPRRVLVHSSGLHGVEAFAGSAIQLQQLSNAMPRLPDDAAMVFVHVLNPYGMAWLRRFNENNVDLNRNFLSAREEFSGASEGFRLLNTFLNPSTPPSVDFFYLRAAFLIARHGIPRLKQAIACGQHEFPNGLFFGGRCLEEGPAKFQDYLAERLGKAERIVALDIHTGLGKFGEDRLLVDAAPERDAVNQKMQAAFGKKHVEALSPFGVAFDARGWLGKLYYRLFPRAEVCFAAQEFGTYHSVRVLKALREENRWHHHGRGTIDHATKTELCEVFNPANETWRRSILRRGKEAMEQGLALLLSPG